LDEIEEHFKLESSSCNKVQKQKTEASLKIKSMEESDLIFIVFADK